MSKEKIVSDAIFGFITLKPHIVAIIDTPEFQRLRCIYQLGSVSFVYPTADHNRFEHSIGTYHLASKLVTQIQQQLKEENTEIQISDADVMCVEIAGLCHDIGHGPFSHFWDRTLLPALLGNNFTKHEKQFSEMWEIIKQNSKVARIVEDNSLDEQLIADLVNGKGKEILRDIISNFESGMDVDKWDYLARDSAYLGHSSTNYRADIERMIHFARAIKHDDTWKIAFRESEGLNMFRVFHLRHYMYKTAYRHRTVVAIDEMLLDGVRQCVTDNLLSLEEIGTAAWIIRNTDAIFWYNINSISLFKRILQRDLYRIIFEAVKYEIIHKNDKSTLKLECIRLANQEKDNIRVVICEFKLGNEDENPMLSIPFYKKNNNKNIFTYDGTTLPTNLTMNCNETRIMIFSTVPNEKRESENNNIENVKKTIKEYLESNGWKSENVK